MLKPKTAFWRNIVIWSFFSLRLTSPKKKKLWSFVQKMLRFGVFERSVANMRIAFSTKVPRSNTKSQKVRPRKGEICVFLCMKRAKMAFEPLCIHDRARWLNAFYTSISSGGAREQICATETVGFEIERTLSFLFNPSKTWTLCITNNFILISTAPASFICPFRGYDGVKVPLGKIWNFEKKSSLTTGCQQ